MFECTNQRSLVINVQSYRIPFDYYKARKNIQIYKVVYETNILKACSYNIDNALKEIWANVIYNTSIISIKILMIE